MDDALKEAARQVPSLAVLVVLVVYFLLPQFSDLPGIIDQVSPSR